MTDPVWSNRFHWCTLAAGFLAAAVEGRLDDSQYVQRLTYEFFETGAFQDRVSPSASSTLSSSRSPLDQPTGLSDSGS